MIYLVLVEFLWQMADGKAVEFLSQWFGKISFTSAVCPLPPAFAGS
jgi:hypothetical protein